MTYPENSPPNVSSIIISFQGLPRFNFFWPVGWHLDGTCAVVTPWLKKNNHQHTGARFEVLSPGGRSHSLSTSRGTNFGKEQPASSFNFKRLLENLRSNSELI